MEPSSSFSVLSGLASSENFEMMKCLLPMEDIESIRYCLDTMERDAKLDQASVATLKNLYSVH